MVEDSVDEEAAVSEDWEGEDVAEDVSEAVVAVDVQGAVVVEDSEDAVTAVSENW